MCTWKVKQSKESNWTPISNEVGRNRNIQGEEL